MADDFGLLLDPIAFQRPARLDRVAITAKGMPPQDQVHALLILPDVDQFVNQMTLIANRRAGNAIAIAGTFGMKVNMPARRHGYPARLRSEERRVGKGGVDQCKA